mgnify:CR=1 FL=1
MKKKHLINITIAIACLLLIVYSGISISKMLLSQKQDTITLNESEDKVIAMENKQTKMTKLETKEYYYYEIEDYERDLKYSWKFKKDENKDISVEESLFIEDDLRLSLDAQTKDTEKIKEDVSQDKLIITFDYHGNLPLETTVRINVQDKFKDNERLYLYYYNPELDQIEYIAHNVLVKDGYVEFELEHCSDYFLTAAVVNDAVNNPQSVNYIIIGLIVVVFILVAVTLFQSKK